jgi:hypothetical protein
MMAWLVTVMELTVIPWTVIEDVADRVVPPEVVAMFSQMLLIS